MNAATATATAADSVTATYPGANAYPAHYTSRGSAVSSSKKEKKDGSINETATGKIATTATTRRQQQQEDPPAGIRQVVCSYELGKTIAIGDFDGRTRFCRHVTTGISFVVRVYAKDVLAEAAWMWERVRESIHVQRTLPKHENIVELVECFETRTSLYIMMNMFDSVNIAALMQDSAKVVQRAAAAAAAAVEAAAASAAVNVSSSSSSPSGRLGHGPMGPRQPHHHLPALFNGRENANISNRPVAAMGINNYDSARNSNTSSAATATPSGGGGISVSVARRIFLEVVSGVYHMHAHGIVHAGIAPDHILVSMAAGQVKISNLISCYHCPRGQKMTELRGTRNTVAPEVLRKEPYDPYLADAWSLGVLLYFMLNDGYYPHDGANTLKHILYSHIRPCKASLPADAKDLIARLLQPQPAERLCVEAILLHPFMRSAVVRAAAQAATARANDGGSNGNANGNRSDSVDVGVVAPPRVTSGKRRKNHRRSGGGGGRALRRTAGGGGGGDSTVRRSPSPTVGYNHNAAAAAEKAHDANPKRKSKSKNEDSRRHKDHHNDSDETAASAAIGGGLEAYRMVADITAPQDGSSSSNSNSPGSAVMGGRHRNSLDDNDNDDGDGGGGDSSSSSSSESAPDHDERDDISNSSEVTNDSDSDSDSDDDNYGGGAGGGGGSADEFRFGNDTSSDDEDGGGGGYYSGSGGSADRRTSHSPGRSPASRRRPHSGGGGGGAACPVRSPPGSSNRQRGSTVFLTLHSNNKQEEGNSGGGSGGGGGERQRLNRGLAIPSAPLMTADTKDNRTGDYRYGNGNGNGNGVGDDDPSNDDFHETRRHMSRSGNLFGRRRSSLTNASFFRARPSLDAPSSLTRAFANSRSTSSSTSSSFSTTNSFQSGVSRVLAPAAAAASLDKANAAARRSSVSFLHNGDGATAAAVAAAGEPASNGGYINFGRHRISMDGTFESPAVAAATSVAPPTAATGAYSPSSGSGSSPNHMNSTPGGEQQQRRRRPVLVRSSWDPATGTYQLQLPVHLSLQEQAAYIIQFCYREYRKRRAFKDTTRLLLSRAASVHGMVATTTGGSVVGIGVGGVQPSFSSSSLAAAVVMNGKTHGNVGTLFNKGNQQQQQQQQRFPHRASGASGPNVSHIHSSASAVAAAASPRYGSPIVAHSNGNSHGSGGGGGGSNSCGSSNGSLKAPLLSSVNLRAVANPRGGGGGSAGAGAGAGAGRLGRHQPSAAAAGQSHYARKVDVIATSNSGTSSNNNAAAAAAAAHHGAGPPSRFHSFAGTVVPDAGGGEAGINSTVSHNAGGLAARVPSPPLPPQLRSAFSHRGTGSNGGECCPVCRQSPATVEMRRRVNGKPYETTRYEFKAGEFTDVKSDDDDAV